MFSVKTRRVDTGNHHGDMWDMWDEHGDTLSIPQRLELQRKSTKTRRRRASGSWPADSLYLLQMLLICRQVHQDINQSPRDQKTRTNRFTDPVSEDWNENDEGTDGNQTGN